jgi:hypothetical protein
VVCGEIPRSHFSIEETRDDRARPDLVNEFVEIHQAEPVAIAKLRWLLAKATVALGEVRLADLSPKQVYAWRLAAP